MADQQHTGRFQIDDTLRKWIVRFCVAWTLMSIAIALLFVWGVWKVAT